MQPGVAPAQGNWMKNSPVYQFMLVFLLSLNFGIVFFDRQALTLGYDWKLGNDLVLRSHIGAKYMSEYNTGSDLDPQKLQEAYTLVNARLGIGRRDDRWAVELWSQNLTDAEYMQVAFDAPLQTGSWNAFLGQPRTYGVTLRWRY